MAGGLSASVWAGGCGQSLRFLCSPLSDKHIALSLRPSQLLGGSPPLCHPELLLAFICPPAVTPAPLASQPSPDFTGDASGSSATSKRLWLFSRDGGDPQDRSTVSVTFPSHHSPDWPHPRSQPGILAVVRAASAASREPALLPASVPKPPPPPPGLCL